MDAAAHHVGRAFPNCNALRLGQPETKLNSQANGIGSSAQLALSLDVAVGALSIRSKLCVFILALAKYLRHSHTFVTFGTIFCLRGIGDDDHCYAYIR